MKQDEQKVTNQENPTNVELNDSTVVQTEDIKVDPVKPVKKNESKESTSVKTDMYSAIKEVNAIFVKRWLAPSGMIIEPGDKYIVNKDVYERLLKSNIVKDMNISKSEEK